MARSIEGRAGGGGNRGYRGVAAAGLMLTPSAEQMRKPIYRGALEQWKNFEPWLGPLKESLGDLANT